MASTLKKVIELVDGLQNNVYSPEQKTAWVNALEGRLQLNVLLQDSSEVTVYDWETDKDTTLMVKPPHDDIYVLWLRAQIHAANGEWDEYANAMEMYNATYNDFVRWFADRYRPAKGYRAFGGGSDNPPYYLSAYGLAVKRGFVGTEEEWLASLVGASAFWLYGTVLTGESKEIHTAIDGSSVGDMYLNTATCEIYKQVEEGVWSYVCCSKGKDGKDGADGKDGVDGKNGTDGIDGQDAIMPISYINPRLSGYPPRYHYEIYTPWESLPDNFLFQPFLSYGLQSGDGWGMTIFTANSSGWVATETNFDGWDIDKGYHVFAYASGSVARMNGDKGEDITITSIEESTEDGGENVVTFSDGSVLRVKNGEKGDKGDPSAGGTVLPHGTCAADKINVNAVTPDVSEKTDGMMILQTFTTDVPQYTGNRILQMSFNAGGAAPITAQFRDNGEEALAAGTYLLRYDAATNHLVVVGRMQEKFEGGGADESEVAAAIEAALEQAKASGKFDGENGKDGKSAYDYAKDSGYTGTEEEFAEKLAETPVLKTTEEITPSEVKALMGDGKPFAVSHTDPMYGNMLFNSFVYSQGVGGILSTVVFETGGVKFCAQIIGNLNSGEWRFSAFMLASTEDIPNVLQTTGDSKADTMSQAAITEEIGRVDILKKDVTAWEKVNVLQGKMWGAKGTLWAGSGTDPVSSASYTALSELIPAVAGASYETEAFVGQVRFYDKNKNYGEVVYNQAIANQLSFTVPENAAYMGISYNSNALTTETNVSAIRVWRTTMSEEEYAALPAKIDALKPMYGKNVVCFGDSIFGMYRDNTSVVSNIANVTGATCYNVGFGGTKWSYHPTAGYSAFSMYKLADAVATGSWTEQDGEAASGSSYFPEQLAILKSIDFNDVDAIVFHYGTNDFTGSTLMDNESNRKDTTTICGAMRYSLERIMTAYPKIKIFVSLPCYRVWLTDGNITSNSDEHTNGKGYTLVDVINAMLGVANEYKLSVINSYYGLGNNILNYSQYLEDGVHHNEFGRKMLGEYIANNMTSNQNAYMPYSGLDDIVDAVLDALPTWNGGAY